MKDLASLTLAELSRLPTKDLLAAFNSAAPKPTARFADHPSGFKRTKALWESLQPKPAVAPATKVPQGKKVRCNVLVAPLSKPESTKEYHSVLAAFIALGLPVEKHQRFRRQVKLNGKATIAQFIFTATYK